MKKLFSLLFFVLIIGLFFYSCKEEPNSVEPETSNSQILFKGTEILGPPEIAVAEGSGFIVAGTGLFSQPGTIDLSEIPSGATVKQVLLYWSGAFKNAPNGDNTIIVEGVGAVAGESIGGPTTFFLEYGSSGPEVKFETFRKDMTTLLNWGDSPPSSVYIEGMTNNIENNGAGMLIIYDDGTTSDIQLFDGQDLAYYLFDPPLDATVAKTFTFDAAAVDRPADLGFLAASVKLNRPNVVRVSIGGVPLPQFNSIFGSFDDPDFDSPTLNLVIPAGATSLTVQCFSEDHPDPDTGDPTGLQPASLNWMTAALSIDIPEDNQSCGRMTGGGSIFLNNDRGNAPRVTHGFEIHCDLRPPNNIEVNWPGGENFHLTQLTYAECLDTEINQTPPHHAPFDTFIGKGYGKYNNVPGAYIEFTFVDAGEPGRNDTAEITIWDSFGGTQVLYVSGNLDRGNHQTHRDKGCGQ